jgi:hypothetical protein
MFARAVRASKLRSKLTGLTRENFYAASGEFVPTPRVTPHVAERNENTHCSAGQVRSKQRRLPAPAFNDVQGKYGLSGNGSGGGGGGGTSS